LLSGKKKKIWFKIKITFGELGLRIGSAKPGRRAPSAVAEGESR
jgi:hypothetical protein